MNSKALKNALSTLIIFFVFIGGLHLLILEYILPETYKQLQLIYIYIFLLVLSIIGVSLLFLVSKNDETLIGKGYLAYSVIKILSSAIFLYPWIANQDDLTKPFIFQFFGIFFPSLIVETLIVLKLVNLKGDQNQKND
jgi:hypothetical protein